MVSAKRKASRADVEQKSLKAKMTMPEEAEGEIEMYSDEDLEGGFEEISESEANGEAMDEEVHSTESFVQEDQVMPTNQGETSNQVKGADARFTVPSLEEIHGLKETSELYMNNVFKLQMDEMIRQVQPDFDNAKAMERALKRIQHVLNSIPSLPPQPLADALNSLQTLTGQSIIPPFCDPRPDENVAYKFAFEKPEQLHLIGSWPLRTATRRLGELDVDMEVCMPSSLFQEKDTFNARYFHKRAFYLAVLAGMLQRDEKLGMDVEFMNAAHNDRLTCLVLRPQNASKKVFSQFKAVIRIHAAHSMGTFPLGRLAPNRNSLRGAALNASEGAHLAPTPRYNSDLASDALRMPHLLLLHSTSEKCAGFVEACQLLKTWASQRGFGSVLSPVSASTKAPKRLMVAGSENTRFFLTMLLTHLLHGNEPSSGLRGRTLHSERSKLSFGYSSYQLMRGVLDFLAKHPWSEKPVFMRSHASFGLSSHAELIPPTTYSVCRRVFVDPSGCLNLLAGWPDASLDLLQQEAAQTLHMLNDTETDSFRTLFLTPRISPVDRFDEAGVATVSVPKTSDLVRVLDASNSRAFAIEHFINIGAKALGSRAWYIGVCYQARASTWALDESQPTVSRRVEFGLRLNNEHAWRQVEHGPSPEDSVACTAFRAFWGNVAELRRFRDGRVVESVVWPVANLTQRAALPRRVLQHAWQKHACITSVSKLKFVNAVFDHLLEIPADLASRAYIKPPQEVGFQAVQGAYDALVKQLRAMDDLPLSVIGVQPVAAALRSMSPYAPGALKLAELGNEVPDCASYLPVHSMILTMESSGRWPDDLAAIQEMKTALYERMAAVLAPKMPGATLCVVYDRDAHNGETIQDQTSLYITVPAGFAFACRIHHDREKHLLERVIRSSSGIAKHRAEQALSRWNTRFVHQPKHHAALQAVQNQHPSLGGCVRMTERWIAAQMLSTQVPWEAVELLTAAVYTSSEYVPPTTSVAGFFRVLSLLRDWDHRENLLLVPIEAASKRAHEFQIAKSEDDRKAAGTSATDLRQDTVMTPAISMQAQHRITAEENFRATRARDPAIHHAAWIISTEYDLNGQCWTRNTPTVTVADALRKLAGRALGLVEAPLVDEENRQVLFQPSLQMYDFVIHVHPSLNTRYAESLQPDASAWLAKDKHAPKNLRKSRPSQYGNEIRPDWDPVSEFVELVHHLYPGILRLFYDQYGGTVIGGIWEQKLKHPHKFKVMLGYNAVPNLSSEVVLNTDAILAEISRLGFGLVKDIEKSK
ncbi:U3 snoRNP protein [Malassezia yamatoensis]|uniref:U3 small nucleolar RNA-associated protein 22 n=1 Tax=Malassezia yamatoensis TaxID=253288 RepID=A0AAJ6CIH7_9BASI|nr:U3 snoRNP protein [Malassezia yamatoensis]